MGLAERQQKYLEQIDEALQRIDEGSYGVCKVTGELIPVERLEEVPVAKYSVKVKRSWRNVDGRACRHYLPSVLQVPGTTMRRDQTLKITGNKKST